MSEKWNHIDTHSNPRVSQIHWTYRQSICCFAVCVVVVEEAVERETIGRVRGNVHVDPELQLVLCEYRKGSQLETCSPPSGSQLAVARAAAENDARRQYNEPMPTIDIATRFIDETN